jgi:hypothetical protein
MACRAETGNHFEMRHESRDEDGYRIIRLSPEDLQDLPRVDFRTAAKDLTAEIRRKLVNSMTGTPVEPAELVGDMAN